MMPLPSRFLTSLYVRYNGRCVLVDCGEGTQITMKKRGISAKPIDVIPLEPAFGVASSFIRADVCRFDLDYPLGADYALQYQLYHEVGLDSLTVIDIPVVVMPEEERDARLLNQRIIKGEYLGVQSQHISWRWVKEYFKWRFLG